MAASDNYTIGRGRIYVDIYDAAGQLTGERYIGNTPSVSINSETESMDHYSSDEGIRIKDRSVTSSDDRTLNFTTDHVSAENLALHAMGTLTPVARASATNLQTTLKVRKNREYQIGTSPANPMGERSLTSVAVTKNGTAVVALNNYVVDLAAGRISIDPASTTLQDGDTIVVTYGVTAMTYQLLVDGSTTIFAAVRYLANNPEGNLNDHKYWPKVALRPDGEYNLKGDEWLTMSFVGDVMQKDDVTKRVYSQIVQKV